jgi:hypothetical protein
MSAILSSCVTEHFQSITRNIMKKLFSKEFATKINWAGQRSDKILLSMQENILKVIYGKHYKFFFNKLNSIRSFFQQQFDQHTRRPRILQSNKK